MFMWEQWACSQIVPLVTLFSKQFKFVGLGDSLGGFAGLGGGLDRGLGRHDGKSEGSYRENPRALQEKVWLSITM